MMAGWHKTVGIIPFISGSIIDEFVKKQSLAEETSVRGYKFFLESYIHDAEGTFVS